MRTTFILHCVIAVWALAVCHAQEAPSAKYSPDDLWSAARQGDCDAIRQAIESGIDADAKTTYGATALAFAAERGHAEAVQLLIERGADVNNKDSFYHATPYSWASMSGHKDVAKIIKAAGGKAGFGASADDTAEDAKPANESEAESPPPPEFTYALISDQMVTRDDQAVSAENWPQFRGSGGRGIADGQSPPLRWNAAKDKNVKWKTAIPGLGHSSPVIWANRIFLTTAVSPAGNQELTIGQYGGVGSVEDNSTHRFATYCIDRESGEILWNKTAIEIIPSIKRHLKATHANCSVATDGQHVVAMFGSEGLYCYSVDGALLWQKAYGVLNSGWFYDHSYEWGYGSSPVIARDTVIVQCDVQQGSFVAAYSLEDGTEKWRMERDEIPSWSTPVVYESEIGPMLITNATNGIRGYDAIRGDLLWTLTGNSEIVVPTPLVAYDTIFVTSGYSPIQPIYAITLQARGDISLESGQKQNQFIRWSRRSGGPYMPTPIAYRGRLYTCSNGGILVCYDAATGKQLYKKRLKTSGVTSFVGSPIAADGYLFVPAEDGDIFVIRAGDKFEQLYQNELGEFVLSTPAIAGGVLFVRGQEHLFALVDKGDIVDDPAEDTTANTPEEAEE